MESGKAPLKGPKSGFGSRRYQVDVALEETRSGETLGLQLFVCAFAAPKDEALRLDSLARSKRKQDPK